MIISFFFFFEINLSIFSFQKNHDEGIIYSYLSIISQIQLGVSPTHILSMKVLVANYAIMWAAVFAFPFICWQFHFGMVSNTIWVFSIISQIQLSVSSTHVIFMKVLVANCAITWAAVLLSDLHAGNSTSEWLVIPSRCPQ